ncbi:MAG: pyridoxal-phosphate dependent enzyme [Polyangiaceae bacterium]
MTAHYVSATGSAPAPVDLLPDDALLDAVRDLPARFPGAGLRRVALTRAAFLDVPRASGTVRVWIADETAQVTGSFKVRGALVALAALDGSVHEVVTASAGNHGAGIAHAAKVLGKDATVVVPRTAPLAKRSKIEAAGARIVLAPSDHFDDAEAFAIRTAAERGARFVSAYDDPWVVAGNGASMGFEIVRALGHVPATVVAPFGGGGLATGIALALARASGRDVSELRPVLGVQTELSPTMALSLERGEAIERFLPPSPSWAEGLEGGIARNAFARARGAIRGVAVVSESSVREAMTRARDELGLVVEGSAAVTLALLLEGLPDATGPGDVVFVLTGRNVDPGRIPGRPTIDPP